MTDAELWSTFTLWLVIAGAVVLVAAGLLVAIWLLARSIRLHATRALAAAQAIQANTTPIWALQSTNEVALALVDVVQSIGGKAGALLAALTPGPPHAPPPRIPNERQP